jgi:hypothetical protein
MEESYVQMQTAIRAIPVLSQKQQEIIQDIVQMSRQNLYCNLTNADLADRHGCSTRYVSATIKKATWLGFLMHREDILISKLGGGFSQIRQIAFEIPDVWYYVGTIFEYAKDGDELAKEYYGEIKNLVKNAYKSDTEISIIKLLEEWGVEKKCSTLGGTKMHTNYNTIYNNIYNTNIKDTNSITNISNSISNIKYTKYLSKDKYIVAGDETSGEVSSMQQESLSNINFNGETYTTPELVCCAIKDTHHNSLQENRSISNNNNFSSINKTDLVCHNSLQENGPVLDNKGNNGISHNSLQENGHLPKLFETTSTKKLFADKVLACVEKDLLKRHAPNNEIQLIFAFWNTLYNTQKHREGSKVYAKAYVILDNMLCGRPMQVKRNGEPTQWLLDFMRKYNIDPSLLRKRWTKEEIYEVLEAVVSEVPEGTKLSLASTLFNNYGKSGPYSRFLIVADRRTSINRSKDAYIRMIQEVFGKDDFYNIFMRDCFTPALKLLTHKTPSEESKLASNLIQMYKDIRACQEKIPHDVRKVLPAPLVMVSRYIQWLGENKWITDISAKTMDINCPLFKKFRPIEAKRHLDIDSLSGKYVH